MIGSKTFYKLALVLIAVVLLFAPAGAQKKAKKTDAGGGRAVLWQPVNVHKQDLYLGPGGDAMKPDLSNITFVGDKKGGHTLKYRITDGSGGESVEKIGAVAHSETGAARLSV